MTIPPREIKSGGHIRYRPELDGLRALAIIPVVLFHAGFSSFRGGFLGVDVFFVISGYLITSIILADLHSANGFSFASFYERRARRILPALLLVLFLSVPAAIALLPPDDLVSFSKSILSTLLFYSNVLFWKQGGYFDTAANLKPLFHTWSLAVEEQFYLFFPVFILLIWRISRRHLGHALISVGVLSFVLSQYSSNIYPSADFYSLFTRGWELIAGSYIAYRERVTPINVAPHVSRTLANIGAILVISSIALFNEQTPHPAWPTLFPIFGTALLIAFGREKSVSNWVLTRRPIIATGLISYSLYLWHQPIFAFYRYYSLEQARDSDFVALIAVSVISAYLTWRYVEKPFRDRTRVSMKLAAATFCGIGALLISAAAVGYTTSGLPNRVQQPAGLNDTFSRLPEIQCFDTPFLHEHPENFCQFGPKNQPLSIFILGDSHAYSMLPAFIDLSQKMGVRIAFAGYSSCLPFLGITRSDAREATLSCSHLNNRIRQFVRDEKIGKIILVGYWETYLDSQEKQDKFNLQIHKGDKLGLRENRAAFAHGLLTTVSSYRKDGVRIFVLSDTPEQLLTPQLLYKRVYTGHDISPKQAETSISSLSVKIADHKKKNAYNRALFAKYAKEIHYADLDRLYCNDDVCPVGTPTASYYSDTNHLSKIGALVAEPRLREIFETR